MPSRSTTGIIPLRYALSFQPESAEKVPVNMSLSAYDSVISPEEGRDWQLRFQVQLLFPTGG